MKALVVENRGDYPVMVPGEVPVPAPGDEELLVKIEATALNRADLFQKAGRYPPPVGTSPLLGLEMAGTVVSAGRDATRFRPGSRVFGLLPGGGYAEYCVIHERMAMEIPENLSFTEAAAIPETFLTAYQALSFLGEIREGETVLIHAGASGVGTSAIQLAKQLFSARIAVTAGTAEKLDSCRELGADLAIHYKEEDFSRKVAEIWGEESIHLIVDVIGSPYWEKNLELISLDGRLILLALLGGSKVKEVNLGTLLRKRLTIRGSTLRNRSVAYKIALTEAFRDAAMEQIRDGTIRPVIHATLDWLDVEKAHRIMEQNRNTGKIVLSGM